MISKMTSGSSRKLFLYRTPIDKPVFIFLLVAFFSFLFSPAREAALRGLLYYFITGFMITFLVANSKMNRRSYKAVVKAVAFTTAVVASFGILELFLLKDHMLILGRIFGEAVELGGGSKALEPTLSKGERLDSVGDPV